MDLNEIKGIGEKNRVILNKMNIYTIEDLLLYFPYDYIKYEFDDAREIKDQSKVMILGKIDSIPVVRYFRAKLNSTGFRLFSNQKMVNVIIYNRAFMSKYLTPGKQITVIGKYDEKKNTITASNILLNKVMENAIESKYHLREGITNKQLTKYINSALELDYDIEDYVPDYLNKNYKFISKKDAIKNIHKPKNSSELKKAKLKLIYEELFMFMFKINYLKFIKTKESKKEAKKVNVLDVQNFIKGLPFELTVDQKKGIDEIHKDLISTTRMNRLLCGDVGSGKTIVGVVASYECFLSGYQTALMAPTELLARQHYENIKELLKNTKVNVALLLGSTKKQDKDKIYEEVKTGKIDFLIGTHAILSSKVSFKNLGLVITDEQHRFGVNQRNSLRNKGLLPDILYMSATPIPRTYALTIYGDMDVSLIKTKPSGRKEIKTVIKPEKELKETLYMMLEEIKKGHQIYVVTPLIEDTEDSSEVRTVTELKEKLDIAFNKKIKIGLLHGKLDKDEKENVMKDFKDGKIKILVSTTVIEVGVDVQNATMMVIFNAERFGLATLHQLRGRIGRNSLESTCILIGPKNNKRLKVLEESTDGFYITEKDFEMRKEGDLFGVKQSGDMFFKIADIKRDYKILLGAKKDSEEFLAKNIINNFKNEDKYIKIVNELKSLD